MLKDTEYPMRHLSIRVPWHDTGWDGKVCAKPHLNGSCLILKRIAQERDDCAEESVCGRSLVDLPAEKWPCCVPERMAFMAPFDYTRVAKHPYSHTSEDSHGHFAPTALYHPAYSAPAVPFSWMLRENMEVLGEEYILDVQSEREPKLGFRTQWIQSRDNQKELLDCFCSHLKAERSLCFFYAKKAPFIEDNGGSRILLGVGRVLNVLPGTEYEYTTKDLKGKLRSMLWERMVQHSIRPDFNDGFILPYHAAIEMSQENPDFDPASIAALSPEDRLLEFSHASQLVTNDGAIAGLLACAESLRTAQGVLPGPWKSCLAWVDHRLSELWKARGPYPGLGAALGAFGIELGTFMAQSIHEKIEDNADPWPLVEESFDEPTKHLPSDLARGIGKEMQEKWKRLPEERRSLLKLISRLEIDREQAEEIFVQEVRKKAGIDCSDSDILTNPYILYESTRLTANPISIWTVDRGVFPDDIVRNKHPLEEPTVLNTGTDARRIRALTVKELESAANNGSTLVPQERVVLALRNLGIKPECPVDGDLMNVAKDVFGGIVSEVPLADGSPALQLERLSEAGDIIRRAIDKRIKGKRLLVDADWRMLLDEHLTALGEGHYDELEEQARKEKTASLTELAESRISVLVGPAGTGKTTLLSVLCSHPKIEQGGVLLLAPTGKARVRMEQLSKDLKLKGYTVAQFLSPHRYNATTGRYHLSEKAAEVGAQTVIVDEASMLTEEMLASLIQALKGVQRLILIGDHRQLPPIGAGRPFVDIVKYLAQIGVIERFPRVASGYAELTIRRRQAGEEREDLQLAEWFSGSPVSPGEDNVFDEIVLSGASKHVRYEQWDSADELHELLITVLVDELKLSGPDDVYGFDNILGANEWNGMRYFNVGAAVHSENWQILSPVRSGPHGVPDINRQIHKQFRQQIMEDSRKERWRKFPTPKGLENIVYGDKVINLINTDPRLSHNRHRKVYPEKPAPYIANGEIGVVVGYFWRKGKPDLRRKLEVEFSSQPGFKYDFTERDFREEANPVLELAYALTVHKSQGSEFGTVILILPNPCRLLSRELLYTALTRQRDRIVILHQGNRSDLRKYTSDDRSEIARRLTNLFEIPSPIYIENRFFEENLIHRTARGEMVRSKSEVIIADRLSDMDVEYVYERPLTIDGATKYPDFTIEDMESGMTFYWEHCGMMFLPSYHRRWEEKLAWYHAHGIEPYEDGGGENGTLIITKETEQGGISSQEIAGIIKRVILE